MRSLVGVTSRLRLRGCLVHASLTFARWSNQSSAWDRTLWVLNSSFSTFLLQKMFRPQHSIDPRLETEVKELKVEIETLKRENAELRQKNNKLKQSLDELVRSTRPHPVLPHLKPSNSESEASSETDSELQRKYNKAIQQLSETRQQLLDVQERLTVSEQVTAATQRRELLQEGVYQNLPPGSVYEKLRFDPTQEHDYAKLQSTTHAGCIFYCCESV